MWPQTRHSISSRVAIALLASLVFGFGEPAFPPDFIEQLKMKNRLTEGQTAAYLRDIYPPVRHPATGNLMGSDEVLSLDVPPQLGNRKLAAQGYVDVTEAPFHADRGGTTDATKALQAAVDFARDHQMACYFPAGTYLISDTLECRQKITVRENGRIASGDAFPCVLIGEAGPRRPRLLLSPRSPGFTDPGARKIVLHVVNCNTALEISPTLGPRHPQANINYNQMVRGLDIVIGEGNGGAIGVRMQAAEGSSIQDMTIDATHGHTGMLGAAGSGGSHHQITVIGGRIGVDTRGWPPQYTERGPGTQPGPTMSRVTLIGQTETPAVIYSTGPFTAVAWHVIRSRPGTAILALNATGQYHMSQVNLIDSRIEFEQASESNVAFQGSQGACLRNVFVKRGSVVHGDLAANPDGWTRVSEYACPGIDTQYKGKKAAYGIEQPVFLDGVRQKTAFIGPVTPQEPPIDLITRHGWGSNFPSFESPGAANARDRYGAKGDGISDDTKALQRAIDENEIVFLPKGLYRVTDTLRLGRKTKLVGVHFTFSQIVVYDPFGALGEKGPRPIVDTPDDAKAETTLAFVAITAQKGCERARAEAMGHVAPFYALRWRAGEKSMVRSPWVRRMFAGLAVAPPLTKASGTNLTFEHPMVRIEGQGGGQWFNFFIHGSSFVDAPGYRHVLVTNIRGPLAFYHFHAQHSEADFQCEVVDASGVDFYGVKTECETAFMRVGRSSRVNVFGHAGWGSALPGLGLYVFEDCRDSLLSCFGSFIKDSDGEISPWRRYAATPFHLWHPIVEVRQGRTNAMTPADRPVFYRIGNTSP